ncbi:hypothetical protein [Gelidibacter japonicus]|uniref:hypothetical protein n=1 Tax=Gelidibacter japonicus TaxID=1962232 RepID=UPI003A8EABE7
MQWKANRWIFFLFFFSGCLISYLLSQFHFLEINYEVNIIETLIAILGIGVVIYIADTIQKNINRNQNRYSFLENKLDDCWMRFIKLSKLISIDNKIPLESLSSFNEDIVHQVSFIKNIFAGFNMDSTCLIYLESKLDDFEDVFDDLKTKDNIKYYKKEKQNIEDKMAVINEAFSEVLNVIQKV